MGSTTNPNPGALDLNAEVPLSKVEVTPAVAAEYQTIQAEQDAEDAEDDLPTGTIDFSTFLKVDMRTGTVTKAEWVPKSDKLLRLEVFFGPEIGTRVILAGIAKDYPGDAIVGLSVVAVVNLAPRKMMGQESHGMLLAAKDEAGAVLLASCPGVPDGSKLG